MTIRKDPRVILLCVEKIRGKKNDRKVWKKGKNERTTMIIITYVNLAISLSTGHNRPLLYNRNI